LCQAECLSVIAELLSIVAAQLSTVDGKGVFGRGNEGEIQSACAVPMNILVKKFENAKGELSDY